MPFRSRYCQEDRRRCTREGIVRNLPQDQPIARGSLSLARRQNDGRIRGNRTGVGFSGHTARSEGKGGLEPPPAMPRPRKRRRSLIECIADGDLTEISNLHPPDGELVLTGEYYAHLHIRKTIDHQPV
jgi:hypothetical protein